MYMGYKYVGLGAKAKMEAIYKRGLFCFWIADREEKKHKNNKKE